MNKRIFSLIIASSLFFQPILAQNYEQKFEQRRLKEATNAAHQAGHAKGFTEGIAASLIASSLAMCAYLASFKDDLYIPAEINPKRIPTGETQWIETIKKLSDTTTIKTGRSEPVYKTVWEANPLHTALKNAPESDAMIKTIDVKENMVQTMSSYMPSAIAITCICTLLGVLLYYAAHENNDSEHNHVRL
jgi:hypothetical protein